MELSSNDSDVLRSLAEQKAEIASLPVHKEKIELWKNLNRLEKVRPLVWINEIPWGEMNYDDELTLKCENEFCQNVENELRRTIYQWRHMPGDMVVEPVFLVRPSIYDSGFGITQESDTLKSEEDGVVSQGHFATQLFTLDDIEKIKMPEIKYDREETEMNYQLLNECFGDVLKVEKTGIGHQWFTLWDNLIRWYGVEEAMLDLILKPELVHAALDRLLQAFMHRLQQFRELNILALDNGNNRVGSGGLGYTDELPQEDFDPSSVRTIDQWGCGNAQIFSEVSPEMHEEFSMRYERQWLEQFGLTYYGCCEPLHNKMDMLATIPNLRKISMSPQANPEKMINEGGDKYVLSHKPNPAILARDDWNPDQAAKELRDVLDISRDAHLEVILKDISTVRHDPQRLWDWQRVAMEEVQRMG